MFRWRHGALRQHEQFIFYYVQGFDADALPDSAVELLRDYHSLAITDAKRLPSNIGQLSNLRRLLLVRCSRLRTIPDSLTSLPELNQLELRGCAQLSSLPASIGQTKCLRVCHHLALVQLS